MHLTSALVQFLRIVIFYCFKSTQRCAPFSLFLKKVFLWNPVENIFFQVFSVTWKSEYTTYFGSGGWDNINQFLHREFRGDRRAGEGTKVGRPTRRWRCISFLFAHSLWPACLFFVFLNKCVFWSTYFSLLLHPQNRMWPAYHSFIFCSFIFMFFRVTPVKEFLWKRIFYFRVWIGILS